MPNWKKVIVSGSNAHLNHVTSSGNISGSSTSTGSFGAIQVGGGHFTSASLAAGGSGGSSLDSATVSGSWRGEFSSSALTFVGGGVSGSSTSTGSFGKVVASKVEGITSLVDVTLVSGSVSSTGSFGRIEASVVSASSFPGLSVGQKFLHEQTAASTTWTMNHNFDFKYPNVDVYDDDDNIVIPTSIVATSVNTLTATFGSAVAGVAIISTGGQAVDERGKNFVFSQETAATNWRVTHSIGEQYPAVTVYDEEDKVIIPDEIIATDGSKLDISFSEAIAGKVNVSVGGGAPTGTVSSSAQIATQLSGSWRGELSSSVYLRQVATTISGSLGSNATLIRSLTASSISGSRNAGAISGSFRGELSSSVYLRQVASTISGSTNAEAVSGSFRGELSSSVYLRQVEETVSGSWRGEFSSSALTNVGGGVSGSSVSTGSFGEIRVGGMSLKSLTTFSSSVATKLNSLDADIIALSIALG